MVIAPTTAEVAMTLCWQWMKREGAHWRVGDSFPFHLKFNTPALAGTLWPCNADNIFLREVAF